MIKKMDNPWKGRSYSLLGAIMVIPQEALHAVSLLKVSLKANSVQV